MSQRTFRARTPLEALLVEQVLARVEALAVPAARELARQAVQATLQAQAEPAEKKGRPAAPAPAAAASGTRGGPAATS